MSQDFHSSVGVAVVKRAIVCATGKDAANFLHKFCTADVLALETGSACEAFFTDVKGKTIGYAILWRTEQGVTIDLDAGQAEPLIEHLDRYIISEDVELSDLSHVFAEIIIAGPLAESTLQKWGVLNPPPGRLLHASQELETGGVSVLNFPLGELAAYIVRFAAAHAEEAINELEKLGAARIGENEWQAFRISAGWPKFGADITDANLPQEVDRNDQAISFEKGCYLGQETVARLDALGHVNKLLVGVTGAGNLQLQPGDELTVDEKPIGKITSAAFAKHRDETTGLAYVRAAHAAAGTVLQTRSGEVQVKRFS